MTNGERISPTTSSDISVAENNLPQVISNEHTERVLSLYGEFPSFMAAFNPSNAHHFAVNPERCVSGISPSLKLLCDTYGYNKICLWIAGIIGNINLMSLGDNPEKKMNSAQIVDCAESIVSNYSALKAAEIMLFLSRVKAGKYGKFYGVIDGMAICNFLNDYCEERKELLRIAHAKLQKSQQEKNRQMIEEFEKFKKTLEYAESQINQK